MDKRSVSSESEIYQEKLCELSYVFSEFGKAEEYLRNCDGER